MRNSSLGPFPGIGTNPTKSVNQARPAFLSSGVLVPEVVDVPGFVGDHQVVAALVHRILEGHEVGDQHLVHAGRSAWKALRSCSPDSSSMWRDSLARRALSDGPARRWPRAGGSPDPAPASRPAGPTLSLRSSRATAMSRRPWPSPIGDDRYSTFFARARRFVGNLAAERLGRRSTETAVEEVVDQRISISPDSGPSGLCPAAPRR